MAAAAGGAAWISALGSAIVAQRLDSVDLPVESVVALMSPEHRFVIGAGYLVAPIFVGLVGFLADIVFWWLAIPYWSPEPNRRLSLAVGRLLLAVVTVGFGIALGWAVLTPSDGELYRRQSVWVLIVVLVVLGRDVVLLRRRKNGDQRTGDQRKSDVEGRRLNEAVIVFLLVLVGAGTIALLRAQDRPPAFPVAEIQVNDGKRVAGGYVTTTANSVLLITAAPAPAHSALNGGCPTIQAVPREQITRLWVSQAHLLRWIRKPTCLQPQRLEDLP